MKKEELVAEISDAIGGHSIWRTRLKRSIKLKEGDLPINDIARADQCRFGKWLATLPSNTPCQEKIGRVKERHDAFHVVTAEVAKLVNEGKTEEAMHQLLYGEFNESTRALTAALNELRRCVMKS